MFSTYNPDIKTHITVFSHRKLIQHLYENIDKNISCTLKQDIFQFNSKKTNLKEITKRKKSKEKEISEESGTASKNIYENKFKTEVEELQKSIESFLITNEQVFQQPLTPCNNNFDLDSIINEPISFPTFKGSNTSDKLIKITLNNHEYIIPPYSKFFNNNIEDINDIVFGDDKFDLIILDPPWRNKYIRRLKKSKMKSSSAYEMLNNDCIKNIPIPKFLNLNTLVVIWCTNSYQHQNAILNSFFPAWKLKLLTKFYWVKMNITGETICTFNSEFGKKQPFETIFIACPENCSMNYEKLYEKKNIIMSVPSLINSHKPPIIEILHDFLPSSKPNCLEIFARYLQPNFTSIGLEVLKLMDSRLYEFTINSNNEVKV